MSGGQCTLGYRVWWAVHTRVQGLVDSVHYGTGSGGQCTLGYSVWWTVHTRVQCLVDSAH